MGSSVRVSHQRNRPTKAKPSTPRPMMRGDPHSYSLPPHTVTSNKATDPAHQQPGAGIIDPVFLAVEGDVEHRSGHEQGDQAHGQIDVEHPPPREVVDEPAAQERSGDAGQRETAPKYP